MTGYFLTGDRKPARYHADIRVEQCETRFTSTTPACGVGEATAVPSASWK